MDPGGIIILRILLRKLPRLPLSRAGLLRREYQLLIVLLCQASRLRKGIPVWSAALQEICEHPMFSHESQVSARPEADRQDTAQQERIPHDPPFNPAQ